MIVKTVKYPGFDGEDIEEKVYLHLTKAEFLKLDMKYSDYGGLINYMRKLLTDTANAHRGDTDVAVMRPLLTFLDTMILAAYGRKLDDGRFVKKINGVPLSEEFESSEAYSQLLIDLIKDEKGDSIEELLMGMLPLKDVDVAAVEAKKAQINAAMGRA